MAKKWSSNNIPDLADKTIIVTGANTGLGYASVEDFSKKGAKVVLACRTVSKGEKAKKRSIADLAAERLRSWNLISLI